MSLDCRLAFPSTELDTFLPASPFLFLFAPHYHPALAHIAPIRRQLNFRTIFNILGPLINPARPGRMVLGVARKELGDTFAEVLKLMGLERALVVCGKEGLDEISPEGETWVCRFSLVKLQGIRRGDEANVVDVVDRKGRDQDRIHPPHTRFRPTHPPPVLSPRRHTRPQRTDIHLHPRRRFPAPFPPLCTRRRRFTIITVHHRLCPPQLGCSASRLWTSKRLEGGCQDCQRVDREWRC
jgi:hypothetical protein